MTLRLGDCSDDSRHDAWTRVVERIYREQVGHAWGHYLFRLVRAVFTTNQRLSEEGGFLFEWMVTNYVDSTLMLLRRELDRQAGTENLRNLLFDMINHPTVMTRERYLSMWGDGSVHQQRVANLVFNGFVGDPGVDRLGPDVIKADLQRLDMSAENLRRYAEQTRAHRSPEPRVDTAGMTFEALHGAIAEVREVIAKYYALLTQKSIAQWEPVPQYDTLGAFLGPWIVDRNAVERGIAADGLGRT